MARLLGGCDTTPKDPLVNRTRPGYSRKRLYINRNLEPFKLVLYVLYAVYEGNLLLDRKSKSFQAPQQGMQGVVVAGTRLGPTVQPAGAVELSVTIEL